MRTNELLQILTADPTWESEWLELLSQMEFVGCRKIVKSVPFEEVNLDVLRHISEEASHAFLLKDAAHSLGSNRGDFRNGLFCEAGWHYFSHLDSLVADITPGREYQAVSWIIEQRAMSVYPKYMAQTRFLSVRKVLGKIVCDETRHSKEFGKVSFPHAVREQMIAIERVLWEDLIETLIKRLEKRDSSGRFSAALH